MLLCAPTVIRLKGPFHGIFSLDLVPPPFRVREQGVTVAVGHPIWKIVDNHLLLLRIGLTFRLYPQGRPKIRGLRG
jgi:hypothetical protein